MAKHKTKRNKIKKRRHKKRQTGGAKDLQPDVMKKYGHGWDRHYSFVVLIVLIALFVSLIVWFTKKKVDEKQHAYKEAVRAILQENDQHYAKKYPQGYAIVVFDENHRLVYFENSSLPEELKIEFQKIELLRVKPELKEKNLNLIRISLKDLEFRKYNFGKETLMKIFNKEKGNEIVLRRYPEETLVQEIVDVSDKGFVSIFGIK